MRKIIIAAVAAAVALPSGTAFAQSAGEVRDSARELRQERRELREAERYGDRRDVRDERRDVRDARQELREDWQDYRRTHRNVYDRPNYVGPRGYRYRPVVVGHRFHRDYYGDRYWIRDYRTYRLPAPGRGLRWIRYGNDVVLVNIRTGRVITVHRRFFW